MKDYKLCWTLQTCQLVEARLGPNFEMSSVQNPFDIGDYITQIQYMGIILSHSKDPVMDSMECHSHWFLLSLAPNVSTANMDQGSD